MSAQSATGCHNRARRSVLTELRVAVSAVPGGPGALLATLLACGCVAGEPGISTGAPRAGASGGGAGTGTSSSPSSPPAVGWGGGAGMGGSSGTGAAGSAAGGMGASGAGGSSRCADPSLVWRTAHKTHYTSYPAPGSVECVKYNGCMWAGYFAACKGKKPESWVAAHNIVAAFPDFDSLRLHDLCLRKGSSTLVATVIDTCADSDCSGCCTRNQGAQAQLLDLESYTNKRWGVADGIVEWADLGPTAGDGCR